LKASEYPGVATVQIIFNNFRQRPKELFFPLAQKRTVGISVRLPLASGLLVQRDGFEEVVTRRKDHLVREDARR
jgi:aryl-alcohol dehydrogenase-like predicted oxidoreductase